MLAEITANLAHVDLGGETVSLGIGAIAVVERVPEHEAH